MLVKKIAIVSLCVVLAIAAGACSSNSIEPAELPSASFATTQTLAPQVNTDVITPPSQTSIALNGAQATIDGSGATADGADVTITDAGTYTITGSTTSGSITVNAPDQRVELVLDGASIESAAGPAILLEEARDPVISLNSSTKNTTRGGGEPYDAAIYGAVSYTIRGSGSLYAYGTGAQGILSMADLTIENGIISVEAMEDGFRATGDGRNTIRINDGEIYVDCEGDSFDCDGSLIVRGGHTFAFGGTGDTAGLKAGLVTVNGGTFLATGGEVTMPDGTGQKYLAYKVAEQPAGQDVTISDGTTDILSTEIPGAFTTLVYSSADIMDGTTYSFSIGGMQFAAGTTASTDASASPTISALAPIASSASGSSSGNSSTSTRRPSASTTPNPNAITPADTPEPEPTEHEDFSDPSFSAEPEDSGANYDDPSMQAEGSES